MSQFEIASQDIRYALRSIRRQPGLALATVLTMALGLGLNVSVFTVLDGLLFRARVDKDPASFVRLSPEYKTQHPTPERPLAISVRDYLAFRSDTRTLSDLAAWDDVSTPIGSSGSDPLEALLVTCNFFRVYGLAAPARGRLFSASECSSPRAAHVAIVSEEFWRNQLGTNPNVIGQTLRLSRTPFTIVGVIPAGFTGRVQGPGIWIPWTAQAVFFEGRDLFRADSTRWLHVEGRLRPGRSRAEAQSELSVIAAQQDTLEPGRKTLLTVTDGSIAEEPSLRAKVFWLGGLMMAAPSLILLIACTNVTMLQLSRATTRRREMGIRLALGAARGRLSRMLLTEVLLLSTVAGLLSVYLAYQSPVVFTKMTAGPSTPVFQTQPDLTVFGYLCLAALASAAIAGLSPAGESLRVDLHGSMKAGEVGTGAGVSRRHSVLVGAQVAMSLTLLVSAALFVRAQYRLFHADPGFETRAVLAVTLRGGMDAMAVAGRIRDVPLVRSVAVGSLLGTGKFGTGTDEVRTPGAPPDSGKRAIVSTVSGNYFDTIHIGFLRGRTVASTGDAVVSQALAQAFWPGKEVIGERIVLSGDGATLAVVGVVRDIQTEQPGVADSPRLYRWQAPSSPADSLVVRYDGDARTVSLAVRQAIRQIDPEASAIPKTLRTIMDEDADRMTMPVRMIGVLGFLALSLSALGIYGVVAFAVSRRTKELGIRMALGATKRLIVQSVLASGMRPIALGLATGIMLALGAAQAIATLMRQGGIPIDARDPLVFASVVALLGSVAILAMLRPALRAAGLDPVKALRDE